MPNATYNVTLFFTEIYWDQPKARLFNISANNRTVVASYDIYAAAGETLLMQTTSSSWCANRQMRHPSDWYPTASAHKADASIRVCPWVSIHRPSGKAVPKGAPEATSHACCIFATWLWLRMGAATTREVWRSYPPAGGHLASHHVVAAKTGGRDTACNLTFPVTLGPLAQLELQFSGVRDNAAVAGIRVSGPMAPAFKIQSFLQNDTASASTVPWYNLLRRHGSN